VWDKKPRDGGVAQPLSVGPNKQQIEDPIPSEKELEELKLVFRLTDENGDGSITSTELKRMLHNKLGIDVDDGLVVDLMNSAGEQAQGLISEDAFITWFLKMQSLSSTDYETDLSTDLFAAFRLFDKDGNGYITMDELKRAMDLIDERLTDSELQSLIQMADVDKDGKIDYEEFLKMLL